MFGGLFLGFGVELIPRFLLGIFSLSDDLYFNVPEGQKTESLINFTFYIK
jgi:hypothetical protein